MNSRDWVRLLEASYSLGTNADAWKAELLEAARPLFQGTPRDLAFLELSTTPDGYLVEDEAYHGSANSRDSPLAVNTSAPRAALDLWYGGGPFAGSLSETVFPKIPGAREAFTRGSHGAADVMGVAANDGEGHVAVLAAGQEEQVKTTAHQRRRWTLAILHVSAGLRLRRRLGRTTDVDSSAEATFAPDGRILDARGEATLRSAREALRNAVLRQERARTRVGRGDPDYSLESWTALVEGRWSLVDRFDRDGCRFVVALENDPRHPDPRGLTRRERQLAEYVGLGQSTKEIAYALGISLSAVSMGVSAACRKLGLRSRTELAVFFAPHGLRARLSTLELAGERFLVGEHPLFEGRALAELSPAEREVATLLLSGATTAEVAAQRGTSESTAANHAASIYRRFGVVSRIELAARLYGVPDGRDEE